MALFSIYKLPAPAQCEADSVKELGYPDECRKRVGIGIRTPKGTRDYALCTDHRDKMRQKGLL